MRSSIRSLLLGAALTSVAVGSLASPPGAAYPDAPSVVAIDGTCEGELLRLHNEARARVGVAALREDPSIDQVARGLLGEASADWTIPIRVIDETNVGTTNADLFPEYQDFEGAFATAWGVG